MNVIAKFANVNNIICQPISATSEKKAPSAYGKKHQPDSRSVRPDGSAGPSWSDCMRLLTWLNMIQYASHIYCFVFQKYERISKATCHEERIVHSPRWMAGKLDWLLGLMACMSSLWSMHTNLRRRINCLRESLQQSSVHCKGSAWSFRTPCQEIKIKIKKYLKVVHSGPSTAYWEPCIPMIGSHPIVFRSPQSPR